MLSIIIVNYKSSADIIVCLKSIVRYEKYYKDYDFIIVDNNSCDPGLMEIEKCFSFVKIIYAPKNNGFAYGNNIGIMSCRGDCILLLNPDTYIKDNSIEKLYSRLQDENIDFIGPKLLFQDGSNQSYFEPKSHLTLWRIFCKEFYLDRIYSKSYLFNSYYRTYMDYNRETYVDAVAGSVFMFKRYLIDNIGYLDENYFMYFEESDYCLQAFRKGYKMLYYPESAFYHMGGLISEMNWKNNTKYYIISFKYFFKKNYKYIVYYIALLLLSVGSILRVIFLYIKKDKKYKYYLYYLKYIFCIG